MYSFMLQINTQDINVKNGDLHKLQLAMDNLFSCWRFRPRQFNAIFSINNLTIISTIGKLKM